MFIELIIKCLSEISDLNEPYDNNKTKTYKYNCIYMFLIKKIWKVFLNETKAKNINDKIQNKNSQVVKNDVIMDNLKILLNFI